MANHGGGGGGGHGDAGVLDSAKRVRAAVATNGGDVIGAVAAASSDALQQLRDDADRAWKAGAPELANDDYHALTTELSLRARARAQLVAEPTLRVVPRSFTSTARACAAGRREVRVDLASAEGKALVEHFESAFPMRPYSVVDVWRNENAGLFHQHLGGVAAHYDRAAGGKKALDLRALASSSYQLAPHDPADALTPYMRHLWHGSPHGTAFVVKSGFYARHCPASVGLIGGGYYFALSPTYSDGGYVTVHADGRREIFLARVFVGVDDVHNARGRLGVTAPLASNHVCVHNLPTMYCVFDATQAYPAYRFVYKAK